MIKIEVVSLYNAIVFYIKGTEVPHREDGPAIISNNGKKEWWINGKRHREDGPAVEWPDGSKCWYVNGKSHREDGPAADMSSGTKEWYIHGMRHREDGPAIIFRDGQVNWYLNHIYFRTKEAWFEALTEEQKAKALYSESFIRG